MNDFIDTLERAVRHQRERHFGKYRAFVADNRDPERLGRCRLVVPAVLGEATSPWALPCVPYGGSADLGFLAIPPVGAQVLAEFLEGDISHPVWTGTFWRQSGDAPAEGEGKPEVKILKTDSGHILSLDDTEGTEVLTLRSAEGAEVLMDQDGSIVLTDRAGATVTLDAAGGRLTVADANGNSIAMSASGIECRDANGNTITAAGSGVEIRSTATVTIEGTSVAIAGMGGEPLVKGTTFLSMFNTHTHLCGGPGSPSSPPVVPLTPAALTTQSTAK